jgi:hypothetical protein
MILTKAELACLLEVETTVAQAKKIIRRNQLALNALKARQNKLIKLGCPHCSGYCTGCAYEVGKEGSDRISTWCLEYSFGGLTAHDIRVVELGEEDIEVFGANYPKTERDKAERWLKGHIEWGREVIRRAERKRRHSR